MSQRHKKTGRSSCAHRNTILAHRHGICLIRCACILAVVGSTLYLYIGATVACRQKRKAESLVKTGCYTGAVGAPDTLYRESSSRAGVQLPPVVLYSAGSGIMFSGDPVKADEPVHEAIAAARAGAMARWVYFFMVDDMS